MNNIIYRPTLINCPRTRGLLNAIRRKTQSPDSLITFSILSMYSCLSQGVIDVEIFEGERGSVSLYIWVVADSGVGKSFVLRLLDPPLVKIDKDFEQKFVEEYKDHVAEKEVAKIQINTIKGLIKELTEQDKVDEISTQKEKLKKINARLTAPHKTRMTIDDSTYEAIVEELHLGPGILNLISPEGASIANGRIMNNVPLLCKAWQGEQLSIDRKSSPSFTVYDPRVSMLILSQKSVLDKQVKSKGEEMIDIGFYPRFLFVFAENNQGKRQREDFYIEDDRYYKQYLASAYELSEELKYFSSKPNKGKILVKFSHEARQYFSQINRYLEGQLGNYGAYQYAKGHGAKLGVTIGRVAALLTYFELGKGADITLGILQDAEQLVMYSSQQYLEFFQILPDHVKSANTLRKYLVGFREDGHRFVKKNKILQSGPRALRNLDKLNMALNELVTSQEVFVGVLPTGLVYIDLYPLVGRDDFMWNKFLNVNGVTF